MTEQIDYGWLALAPSLFLVSYMMITKRILDAIILSTLFGCVLLYKATFFIEFVDLTVNIMQRDDVVWLILVCGFMGSVMALVEKSGGALAFGRWLSSKSKSPQSTLLNSWLLGFFVFVDDYLNSLTIGTVMRKPADKNRIPREMLAYVADSTAAPVSALMPISTWGVFVGSLMVTEGLGAEGEEISTFVKTIQYNYYAVIALILVPLFIYKIIPIFGPMKKAYERVERGGDLAPKLSSEISIHTLDTASLLNQKSENILNFIVPMGGLIIFTLFLDFDLLYGTIATLFMTVIFFAFQRILTIDSMVKSIITGMKNMFLPILVLVSAYMFAEVDERLGLISFIIDLASPWLTVKTFPPILFILLAVEQYITGSNWGLYVIGIPIAVPLANIIGVDPYLAVGIVVAAGTFGSHCCFYSDATVITSAATGCDNYQHGITQAPFALLAGGIALTGYTILGLTL